MAYIEREKAKELIKNFGKGAIEDGQKALDPADDIILLAEAVDLIPAVDNVSAKCNCCVCEAVCKYKQIYQNGVESILNTTIQDTDDGFWKLRDCPHIEVSIRCPHIVTSSQRSDNNAE